MSNSRREARKKRKKQLRINSSFKKKLCQDKCLAPCVYCKKAFLISQLTIEHIVPLSFGGSNDESNIVLACATCNHERGRASFFLKKEQNKKFYQNELSKQYSN